MNENPKIDILLVEDNIDDAELALHALSRYHLANSIRHVRDGEEALDYLYGRGIFKDRNLGDMPLLILLDLKMPKVDGIEVLRTIKSDPELKIIPVVMLTTSRQDSDMARCYELGTNSYIVKPVEFDNFVEAIRELGFYWLLLNEKAGSLVKT